MYHENNEVIERKKQLSRFAGIFGILTILLVTLNGCFKDKFSTMPTLIKIFIEPYEQDR